MSAPRVASPTIRSKQTTSTPTPTTAPAAPYAPPTAPATTDADAPTPTNVHTQDNNGNTQYGGWYDHHTTRGHSARLGEKYVRDDLRGT